ncbi:MAG: hypothetical protein ACRCWL_14585, partial [Aeromonas sp.]
MMPDENWQNSEVAHKFCGELTVDKYCRLEKGRVKLPAGLSWVKFRQSRPVEGKIKNATVS